MLDELAEAIEEVLPNIVAATGSPGVAVALATATELRTIGSGYADLAQRIPMTGNSVGPAGSLTKPLLGVALMQMVEAGAMTVDAPINDFLPPGLRPADPVGAPVTPMMLGSHQGGYRTDFIDATLHRPGPFADHFARRLAADRTPEYGGVSPLLGTPGTYAYSSLGMSLLGCAVEHLTGLGYAEYVDEHILRPLRMNGSALPTGAPGPSHWDELWQRPDRAVGYMGFGGWCVPTPEFHAATYPAAGMVTSPADYARLLRSLLRSTAGDTGVVSPESVAEMLVPRILRSSPVTPDTWAGIALEISNPERLGRQWWWGHSAAYPWGHWWDARVYPHAGLIVVAMTNKWDMMRLHNPADRNAAGIVAQWAGRWAVEGVPARPRQVVGDGRTAIVPTSPAWIPDESAAAWIGALTAERAYGTLGVTERWDAATTKSMVLDARPSDGSNPPGLDPAAFEAAVDTVAALAPDPDAIRDYGRSQGPEAALWALACGASTAEFPMPVAALAGPHP
ncbi:serine hydrolase domain-containing protein [Nocardia terpenica]|uniref:Penicillin-binding protein n=1 Tax=Nocardia terpenica TaxID=455432 RepID=A0A164N1K8_9NOCA|nr:serine hydrolase domain-containing protein [Nocardia terpenica]KZM73882.1 penicillin-binding protein [Nocardia terpenica]NQE86834.1 beta-lactamase family protein [Nocardia terpenica]